MSKTTYEYKIEYGTNHLIGAFNTFFRVLNSVPQNIYSGTIDATNMIANKLQLIGDNYGEIPMDHNDTGFILIKTIHFKYFENLRKKERNKYNVLLKLLAYWKQIGNDTHKQNQLLVMYFSRRNG